ncbi:MAG: adenosylhomocysteinase, partial [Clostridiales bacterium]|nr:adenosylhomocysteinase [Clostridiales bacterium]
NIIIDDGGDLVELLHGELRGLSKDVIAGSEETTTGVMRLRRRAEENRLLFPMVAVNDAKCKYLFDNRYGTGQSVFTALMQVTNRLVAGKTVVVAGYGWCGKGIAMRAAAMGAKVIVTEILPYRALEAAMDGYRVMKMEEAAPLGDIFITATGCKDVIRREHLLEMKDEALLANAGHFDVEISKPDLDSISARKYLRRDSIEGYELPDGRKLNLIAEGRLVNIAAGNGHPAEIMDMSFALQALTAAYIAGNPLAPGVHDVPDTLDEKVAILKLKAMELSLDTLSPEQKTYLGI